MKVEALVINRGRAKLFKNAQMNSSQVNIKRMFKGEISFLIPDKSKFFELEKWIGTKPFILCDELTHQVLGWEWNKEIEQMEETDKTTNEKTIRLKANKIKEPKPFVYISQQSDPTSEFKMNTLTKTSFWEMLAKRLKMGLGLTLIYLGAGGGLFLLILELISVLFLKKHLFS